MAGFSATKTFSNGRMQQFARASEALQVSDPFKSSIVLLLPMTGANAGTTFTDVATGKTGTVTGALTTSTAQSQFDGSSGQFAGGGYLSYASHADFGFGSGDWAAEGFIRPTNVGDICFLDTRTASNQGIAIYSSIASNALSLNLYNNTSLLLGSSLKFTNGIWSYWRASRTSNALYMQVGSTVSGPVTDSRTYASASTIFIGSNYLASQTLTGNAGPLRIYKGAHPFGSAVTPIPRFQFAYG